MSKTKQPKKAPSKYDDQMHLIISHLRVDPTKLVELYKDELDDCLAALPKKIWEDQTLVLKVLEQAPTTANFIKKLKNLPDLVYIKLVELDSKNFALIPDNMLKQKFINKMVSKNIKNIHVLPTEYRTYETLEHFYSTYSNKDTIEIIEELFSYKSSLTKEEIKNLEDKFGVLSFNDGNISVEKIEAAIEKNAFNIYTVPQNQLSELCVLKAIEKNPEVALCKKIKFTDRIKQAFLRMLASMDKFKASEILNRAVAPFVKMIQEYDKKVNIVKDWSFFTANKQEQLVAA